MAEKSTEPKQNRLTGLKKRQQIEGAGKAMFLWVAIAAVALSICVATGQYLFTKWDYNNRVLSAKYQAAQTLTNNLANAEDLKQEIDSLVANQDLASVKTNANDPNTKSILDALPTDLDSAALATSLQQVILSRSGVSIEAISVPPDADTSGQSTDAVTTGAQEIKFSFVVNGTYDKVQALVKDLERTIRPMKIVNMSLTGSDANLRGSFDLVTYFQPAKTVNLKEEVVR